MLGFFRWWVCSDDINVRMGTFGAVWAFAALLVNAVVSPAQAITEPVLYNFQPSRNKVPESSNVGGFPYVVLGNSSSTSNQAVAKLCPMPPPEYVKIFSLSKQIGAQCLEANHLSRLVGYHDSTETGFAVRREAQTFGRQPIKLQFGFVGIKTPDDIHFPHLPNWAVIDADKARANIDGRSVSGVLQQGGQFPRRFASILSNFANIDLVRGEERAVDAPTRLVSSPQYPAGNSADYREKKGEVAKAARPSRHHAFIYLVIGSFFAVSLVSMKLAFDGADYADERGFFWWPVPLIGLSAFSIWMAIHGLSLLERALDVL